MASSSPPPPPGNSTRSPIRQSVALRWTHNAAPAPAPAASKTAHSPVKRWPKIEAHHHAPAIATPTQTAALEPRAEKNATVSAFQSARAVFEAKKSTAAASPPSPPSRRRLTFPVRSAAPPTAIEKQNSGGSDLSVSSSSTMDSESDRKLVENVETKHESVPSSSVRELKKVQKELVVVTPSKRVPIKELTSITEAVTPLLARETSTSLPHSSAVAAITPTQVKQKQQKQVEIDPFRLLLPVEAFLTLPDEVISVYDNAAVEMEKNIKKIVRKLLKKDKVRLEEFKVNSRLFGTNFMDSHAYLDTLIKGFGPIRALQLVPCLLSVQPDILKSNALLLCSKNYVLQNKEALQHEFKKLQASIPNKVAKVPTVGSVATSMDIAVKSPPPAGTSTTVHSVATTKAPITFNNVVSPAGSAQNAFNDLVPATVNVVDTKDCQPPASEVLPAPAAVVVQNQPTNTPTEEVVVTTNKVIKPSEPMPEPQERARSRAPPLINISVSTSNLATATVPVLQVSPIPAVKKRAESDTPSDSEEEFRAENLFGETIKPAPQKHRQQQQQNLPEVPSSPASSTQSYEEAENLFGERLSSPSRSSVSRRKTVTLGETKSVEVPTDTSSPVKTMKKPAPFIFGPATAAAFDSDESDFSD